MLNLVSDSSCDLFSGELRSPSAQLTVVPMCLHVGGQDYPDQPGLNIPELLEKLAANGQIATQYVDLNGVPGMDVDVNPNGSAWAVEGITSPDGRVLGKMGHSERIADGIYRNVSGVYDMKLFASAKKYFD